jgi:hypothetical protein
VRHVAELKQLAIFLLFNGVPACDVAKFIGCYNHKISKQIWSWIDQFEGNYHNDFSWSYVLKYRRNVSRNGFYAALCGGSNVRFHKTIGDVIADKDPVVTWPLSNQHSHEGGNTHSEHRMVQHYAQANPGALLV